MTAHLIPNMSIDTYHASFPDWVSKTTLGNLQKHGPQWFQKVYVAREFPPPRPPGAIQGMALDLLLTEGQAALDRQFPRPPKDAPRKPTSTQRAAKKPKPKTVEAIAWWDAWEEAHAGALSLSDDDWLILPEAADAVRKHPMFADIQKAQSQATLRRLHDCGLGIQGRPDWIDLEHQVSWDLKKTASLDKFPDDCFKFGYILQAHIVNWICSGRGIGIPLEKQYLVAVEWERGARCECFEINYPELRQAAQQFDRLVLTLQAHIKCNDWTNEVPKSRPLPIPGWRQRSLLEFE